MKKKAFSLIELLISLITISVIVAAMAPIITHKLKHSNVALSAKSVKIDCAQKFGTDCMMCNQKSCLWCTTYINVPDGQYVNPGFGCDRKNCADKFGSTCTKCTKDYCLGCLGGYGYNSANHSCSLCSAPYVSQGGSSVCTMCNQGYKYQNEHGKTDCKECDTANGYFPNQDRLGCTLKTCPKGYRREGNGCVACSGNTYQSNDNYSGTSCYSCGSNSAANSSHTGCYSTCENASSCSSNQTYDGCHCVAKQEEDKGPCAKYDAILVQSGSTKFCMKKYNAGDGGGSIEGISTGQQTQKKNGKYVTYTDMHCWVGTTASPCTSSNYSGCTRTVCNWYAANHVCSVVLNRNNGENWRLPASSELNAIKDQYNNVSKNQGTNGLQLCKAVNNGINNDGYQCMPGVDICRGSSSGDCWPSALWGLSRTSSSVWSINIGDTINSASSGDPKNGAYSVRCVKPL